MLMEGFLLGLASGGACLTYCAPVLVPYLLGEGRTVRASLVPVAGFLGGRLAGYMVFAILAWLTHSVVSEAVPHQKVIFAVITIVLASLLIVYGFTGRDRHCRAAADVGANPSRRSFMLMPISLGFLTGVNVCPPFLLAFSRATQLTHLWQSLLFFAAFFVGTSVYVAPLPLVGLTCRSGKIRIVGRLAAGVVGLFYLYSGLVSMGAALR
jgi:hypothetical protein